MEEQNIVVDDTETTEPAPTPEEKRKEIPGNLVSHFRALIKVERSIAKAEHHIEVLTTYITKENPPAGLTPRIKPQIPYPPVNFLIQWQEEQQRFGLNLTKQLLDFWKERAKDLGKDKESLVRILKQRSSHEEWGTITQIIEEKVRETVQELKRKKIKPARSRVQLTARRTAGSREQSQ